MTGDPLDLLARRQPITAPVLIVVAHPDDETLGLGGSLHLLPGATLVHVTDGAPRDGHDIRRAGHCDADAYAQARHAELDRALAVANWRGERLGLTIPDQQASVRLPSIRDALVDLLAAVRPDAVFTHAYEGGHPDHDATACAVHAAMRALPDRPPTVIEMGGYHAEGNGTARGRFLPATTVIVTVALSAAERQQKEAMLACFASQRDTLAPFDRTVERFRIAPAHDFMQAPHAGELHYERYPWGMTGARFRVLAAALSVDPAPSR